MPGLESRVRLPLRRCPRARWTWACSTRRLAEGQVDLVVGSATDGLIAALDLVVLEDDRRYFPPYDAVPVANAGSLREHPGLAEALARLAGRIDAATMRRMNYAVDGRHRSPADVAREVVRAWRDR